MKSAREVVKLAMSSKMVYCLNVDEAEQALRAYAESIREDCARKVEGFKEDNRPDVFWHIDVEAAARAIRSLEIK